MTIRIEVTNPAEHQPSELRAVATFLNNLAADRETGRIEHVPAYRSTGSVSVATHEVPAAAPLASAPQATSAAPGASSQSETETDADASGACDISQLDSEGVKWDERIHSETKSQNKDGTWRLRRGVDKTLVEQVIAEQRAAGQQQDDTPPPPPADEPEAPELPAEDDTPPPPAEDDVKPADVIKFISSNKLETATVNAMAEQLGMARAADLFTKPQLAGQLLELLKPLVA
jgi:hypothetical protein